MVRYQSEGPNTLTAGMLMGFSLVIWQRLDATPGPYLSWKWPEVKDEPEERRKRPGSAPKAHWSLAILSQAE
jgi:hypothetical protein